MSAETEREKGEKRSIAHSDSYKTTLDLLYISFSRPFPKTKEGAFPGDQFGLIFQHCQ